MPMNKKIYAIYDKEGLVICVGNAIECSRFLGIDINTLYSKVSKLRKGKTKNCKFEIYQLGNESEYN